MQPRLVVDVETCSTINLTLTSAQHYAEHPDTQVICVGWHFAGDPRPPVVGEPRAAASIDVYRHIQSGGVLVAHNRRFEQAVFRSILGPRHGWPVPADSQWSDTMARAACRGWPASLEMLGTALNLTHRKSKAGNRLMLQMSRPRGFDQAGRPIWWHVTDAGKLAGLMAYCKDDVLAEEDADLILPELTAHEAIIWGIDNASNNRGLCIDLPGVQRLHAVVVAELARLDAALHALTGGAVPRTTNLAQLKAWLKARGTEMVSLDREHITAVLGTVRDAPSRAALSLRLEAAKASTAKLAAMQLSVSDDGRARDLFAYYGAGRTGRWAGRRIQPQNLVRGFKDPKPVFAFLAGPGGDLDGLRALWPDDPLTTVAKALRGCIIPAPGRRLVCVDLAQIEARIIAWLGRQKDVLDVFRRGEDIYAYTAARHGSSDRQFGKVVILGCGFGMNGTKFHRTAQQWGLTLDQREAYAAVKQWRDDNPNIVNFWGRCENAMRLVLGENYVAGTRYPVNDLVFTREGDALAMHLPSGRALYYQDAYPSTQATGTFSYRGGRGARWADLPLYGTLLVQNATQALARDVMADAMIALSRNGWPAPVGTVHDEIIQEVGANHAQRCLDETLATLSRTPRWAPGLPCAATGFITTRYRKD